MRNFPRLLAPEEKVTVGSGDLVGVTVLASIELNNGEGSDLHALHDSDDAKKDDNDEDGGDGWDTLPHVRPSLEKSIENNGEGKTEDREGH